MGKGKKPQPARLAAKLLGIRKHLRLSQEQMVALVIPGIVDTTRRRANFSEFEKGRRTPSLLEVFQYAKAVRDLTEYKDFSSDDLIDDTKTLPWT